MADNKGVMVFCEQINGKLAAIAVEGLGIGRQLADDLGISANVRFADFMPGDGLYSAMKSARVFVLPSVREGFGLVVLEANACGLPVITVRHPDNAARHLVFEGKNGFIAELDDADLALTILLVLAQSPTTTMDPRGAALEAGLLSNWDSVADQVVHTLFPDVAGPAANARVLDHE